MFLGFTSLRTGLSYDATNAIVPTRSEMVIAKVWLLPNPDCEMHVALVDDDHEAVIHTDDPKYDVMLRSSIAKFKPETVTLNPEDGAMLNWDMYVTADES